MDEAAAEDPGDEPSAGAPAGRGTPPPRTGAGRWVESSWDLCRGLTVREGLPPDADLDEWIEALLRG